MKYWTIQTENIIKDIQKNGYYQPDFTKSRYLSINNNLNKLYSFVLKSFNSVNQIDLPGIVFAFANSDGYKVTPFCSYEEFYKVMKTKIEVVGSLWNHLKADSVIVELDYDDNFNPVFIDINDFQFLMPPIIIMPPYTQESFKRIVGNLSQGKISHSEFPSDIIQAHLPFIQKNNVTNIYPFFDLE